MERNKTFSCQAISLEEPEAFADMLWLAARCSELPSGVDYYLLDIAAEHSVPQASRWLNLVLNLPCDSIEDLTVETAHKFPVHTVIAGLELYRRRRARSNPKWKTNHSIFTNRYNRARSRALSLLDEIIDAKG